MVIDDLIEIAEKERAARKKHVVRCCMAAGCMSSDSKGVKEALEKAVKGMLPKGPLGYAMVKKLKVYAGGSHPHTAQQPKPLEI